MTSDKFVGNFFEITLFLVENVTGINIQIPVFETELVIGNCFSFLSLAQLNSNACNVIGVSGAAK